MNSSNEQQWLTDAKKFNKESLGAIYDHYSPGIYRYALRLLGNTSLAEDCVAETFSRFLQTLKAGNGPENYLQAYLYRIAHNWITDNYRHQPQPSLELNESLQENDPTPPEVFVEKNITRQQVRMALRCLTPDQRQVISLRFYEGWENFEIAQTMEKPIGAIKALQYRALQSLRSLLLFEENERENESIG